MSSGKVGLYNGTREGAIESPAGLLSTASHVTNEQEEKITNVRNIKSRWRMNLKEHGDTKQYKM